MQLMINLFTRRHGMGDMGVGNRSGRTSSPSTAAAASSPTTAPDPCAACSITNHKWMITKQH